MKWLFTDTEKTAEGASTDEEGGDLTVQIKSVVPTRQSVEIPVGS